jgi:threonine/homoserine/homoserine lactone efflux protein
MFEIISQYFALWVFITLMVSTPGPANLLLLSSGAQNGYLKSLSFLSGLVFGKLALNILFSLGLGLLVRDYLIAMEVFSYICVIYMIWLSLKGWNSHKKEIFNKKILSFKNGVFVHPLSPKTWAMCLIAYSKFTVGYNGVFELYFLVPMSFFILQIIFHNFWCILGDSINRTVGLNEYINRFLIFLTILTVIWALIFTN